MFTKKKNENRSSNCHLRSKCKAKSNRCYYNRLLKDDFDVSVIKRDTSTGEYSMSKANVK